MNKILAFIFSLVATFASAQDGPNHSVPIFGGPGFIGFRSAGPCAAGLTLGYTAGPTADPTCTNASPAVVAHCVGDGVADDTACLQAVITAAAGAPVFVPVGQYRTTAAITNTSGIPMHIFGVGTGAGPGPAAQLNSNVTQFIMDSDSNDLFVVSSFSPSIFRDFQINKAPAHRPGTGGVGIKLIGTGTGGVGTATVANYKIENVGFTNVYTPIRILRPAWGVIRGNYFDTWANAAIYLETSAGIEGSGGHIVNNFVFGTASYGSPAIYSEVGYTVINSNEILGGTNGIHFNIKNFDAGFIKITNNTIENFGVNGINISRGDTTSLSTMVMIQNNEFSSVDGVSTSSISIAENTTTPIWVKDITVSGNVSRNNMGSVNGKHIWIQAGQNVQINNNIIQELSANNPTGIQITGVTISTGLAAPFNVYDNVIVGTTNKYQFATNPALIFRDGVGSTVATLPANAGNGSTTFATDGVPGSNPITGSGTGTWAFRENGAWVSRSANVLLQKQVFTASGTFTAPAMSLASTVYKVTVVGGGGGGAGGATANVTGGAGGGGGTAIKWYTGLVASTGYTVTIGTGGAGGAAAGNGTTGNNSSFAGPGTTITGNAGVGAVAANVVGAAGGTATNGDINIPGGDGGNGTGANVVWQSGGYGGGSSLGPGGRGGLSGGAAAAGQAATVFGAGGGGGNATPTNQGAGGAGKDGIAIFEWIQHHANDNFIDVDLKEAA